VLFSNFGRSLVYSRYRIGPSTLPCGTPAFISLSSEYASSCLILKNPSIIYDSRISVFRLGRIVLSL
jgi:ABC-type uncharacterized transport system permease subunit